MKKIGIFGLAAIFAMSIIGCGSSSSGGDPAVEAENTAPVATGTAFYVDAPIEGVTARCGATVSVTDAQGRFTYEVGQTCTFSLGDILLREESGIVEDGIIFEDRLRVAQFLQTLDIDGDPDNGLTVSAEVLAVLATEGVVTLPANDDELAEMVEKIRDAGIGYTGGFVSSAQAQAHLDATKEKLAGTPPAPAANPPAANPPAANPPAPAANPPAANPPAPAANPPAVVTYEDIKESATIEAVTVDVLANDTVPEGVAVDVSFCCGEKTDEEPGSGTWSVTGDNMVVFTPAASFAGGSVMARYWASTSSEPDGSRAFVTIEYPVIVH